MTKLLDIFPKCLRHLHSYQLCITISFSDSSSTLDMVIFSYFSHSTRCAGYCTVILICTALMMNDVEDLFMHLFAIHTSFLLKCLLWTYVYYQIYFLQSVAYLFLPSVFLKDYKFITLIKFNLAIFFLLKIVLSMLYLRTLCITRGQIWYKWVFTVLHSYKPASIFLKSRHET